MHATRASSTSRRTVLRGFAAGLAGASLAPWVRSGLAADGIAVTPITDELAMLTGAGCNLLVLSTADGQVLIDSGPATVSDAVLATLDELPGDRVAALFNTHWHLDQVGSNEAVGTAGATLFAHEKTRQRLATGYYRPDEDRYVGPLSATGLPTETIYTNGSAQIGGQRIDYGYLIEAHTDGDIFVAIPDLNVIAVGDVLSPDSDPVFDWFGGGWLGGRLDSIDLLLEQSDEQTRFVPSHGPIVSRADVQTERELLLELFDLMVEHVRLGETAKDMLDGGALDGLNREFDDPYQLLYDLHKGFWAHHNKLMHDIV